MLTATNSMDVILLHLSAQVEPSYVSLAIALHSLTNGEPLRKEYVLRQCTPMYP